MLKHKFCTSDLDMREGIVGTTRVSPNGGVFDAKVIIHSIFHEDYNFLGLCLISIVAWLSQYLGTMT